MGKESVLSGMTKRKRIRSQAHSVRRERERGAFFYSKF